MHILFMITVFSIGLAQGLFANEPDEQIYVRLLDPRIVVHTQSTFPIAVLKKKTDMIGVRALTASEAERRKKLLAVELTDVVDQSSLG